MKTINTAKVEAVSQLIENFTKLLELTADNQEQKEIYHQKGYTVITRKIKCNGTQYKGYKYSVEISDGKNNALFSSKGDTKITLSDFGSGHNEHGSKFYAYSTNPGVLHQLRAFGKSTDSKKQKAAMMEFIKSCLDIPICFTEGTFTYAV